MYHETRSTYDDIAPELYTFHVDDSNKATELNSHVGFSNHRVVGLMCKILNVGRIPFHTK